MFSGSKKLTLLLGCSLVVAVGAARAETPAASPDGGSSDGSSQAEPAPAEGGSGLFEQSVSSTKAPEAASPAGGTAGLQLSGYTRGDVFIGKVPGSGQANMKAGYGELALIARAKKEEVGDAFAEVRLRYGMLGEPQQSTAVDVREAYVNTYLGPLDLRLGKQIIVWGRADLLNPTNNLTPFNFRMRSPIEDDRRLGNVGARAVLRLSPVRVEGVWLPTYVANELPPVNLPQYVTYGDPKYPKPELDKGLLAGRVHLELPAVEMSVSYLHGYAPMPGLTRTSVSVSETAPGVVIARTAYKQQVVGFDFSTAIGDLVALRGEVAYRKPYDYQTQINAPKPDLQYAIGGDHNFGSVSLIVQYLGRYTFDWVKENGPADTSLTTAMLTKPDLVDTRTANGAVDANLRKTNQILFSQTEKVQHLATARVEWLTAHDTLSLSALGMYNFSTKEWLASPRIGYRLSDSMIAYVGGEVLTGPSGTLFGLVDQQLSAGYVELRSTF
jgi:hypothetical protein